MSTKDIKGVYANGRDHYKMIVYVSERSLLSLLGNLIKVNNLPFYRCTERQALIFV